MKTSENLKYLNGLKSNHRFFLNVLLPALYFIPLAVAYFSAKYFGFGFRLLVYVGLCIGAVGMAIWILSVFYLGSSFVTLPSAKELVKRGIYRFIRHPMYLGISLTVFGLMLACGSTFGMIYLLVIILPLNFIRSRMEDRVLEELFELDFEKYKKQAWF